MLSPIAVTAMLALAALASTGTAADWSTKAAADISAAHDIIRDNHPGPVDAENPGFGVWL